MNISHDYDDIIKPNDIKSLKYKRNTLLSIMRPLTDDENKELSKLSYLLLLQQEITNAKRKYKNRIKHNLCEGVIII